MSTFKSSYHGPEDFQSYTNGADRDTNAEMLSFKKGYYVDAFNMRPYAVGGNAEAMEQIGGEELIYDNVDNRCIGGTGLPIPGNYTCIGCRTVLNHIVEFWADEDKVRVPFVRIDGWIVLMPSSINAFPISVDNPLQMDKNDSCVGGEIYCTDNNIPPFFFNVSDLLENSGVNPANNERDSTYQCTNKYFSGFQFADYQIQLSRPLDHPVFIEVITAGSTPNAIGEIQQHGTGGMKVGGYQYAINYSTKSGDTTEYSELTPVIPMPAAVSPNSPNFPGIKTYGASTGTVPGLGMHIRFRVSNTLNYDTINVRRVSFNIGAAIGTTGLDEVIAEIPITAGEYSIIDFYDYDNTSISAITPSSLSNLGAIQSAKSLRYYNSRLFLFNITYQSRVLTTTPGPNQVVFNSIHGHNAVPVTEQIGTIGHRDIWNSTYRKNYFRGEKYGFGLNVYDVQGLNSFVLPIPGLTNFQMPYRRDGMGAGTSWPDSLSLSPTVYANPLFARAANSNNAVSQTFEVFDLVNGISQPATGLGTNVNISNVLGPYQVIHPTSDSDSNVTGHRLNISPSVSPTAGNANPTSYSPQGYAPNIYALGLSVQGMSTLPVWVKAFSIVRTAPAGYVVCQGQGFYNLSWANNVQKDTNSMAFDSPDIKSGITSLTNITSSITTYGFQLASALGFFTEMYSGLNPETACVITPTITDAIGIDMICYARVLQDNGQINLPTAVVGIQDTVSPFFNYTSFNSWRNPTSSVLPNAIYTMGSFGSATQGSAPRRNAYVINFTPTSPYFTGGTLGFINYNDPDVKNWHEPAFVGNIINSTQNVPNSFIQTYYDTGAYVKIDSIIGEGDGVTTQYYLVDERWEDCVPAINPSDPSAGANRFIYIEQSTGAIEAWLNVSYMSSAVIAFINSQIQSVGFYTTTKSDGTIVTVTGLYAHGNVPNPTNSGIPRVFYILFNQKDASGNPYIPGAGSLIHVYYDDTAPITVFGGDTYIGEFEYPLADCTYGSNGNEASNIGAADLPILDRPFPYPSFTLTSSYDVLNSTKGFCKNQVGENISFNWNAISQTRGKVRQLIVSGILESRINTSLDFGDTFPHVNYIVRPYSWTDTGDCNSNDSKFNKSNNLYSNYLASDYPGECANWGYGGFRMFPSYNVDYSALPVNSLKSSKPLAGFTEETKFCSRVIWSERRPVNDVGAPGIQTFPVGNVFDLGDETGEIKFGWNCNNGRDTGNLYAFTEHGIARLLVENLLLEQQSGGTLAAIGSTDTTEIQQSVWITKDIGMNDQTWRSAAEWDNVLYWMNKNSVYRFDGNKAENIQRRYKTIVDGIIDTLQPEYGTDMTSFYDQLNEEYWLPVCQKVKRFGYLYKQGTDPNNPANLLPAPQQLTLTNSTIAPIMSIVGDQINLVNITVVTSTTPFYICNGNTSLAITVIATGATTLLQPIAVGQCYLFTFNGTSWTAVQQSPNTCILPVFSEKVIGEGPADERMEGNWTGTFGYQFDRYTAIQNNSYGVRNIQTWKLNTGTQMNGSYFQAWVMGVTSGMPAGRQGKTEGPMNVVETKEWLRIRVSTNGTVNAGKGTSLGIPTYINFYDRTDQFVSNQPQGTISQALGGPYYLKDYGGGWEQYVPRRLSFPYIAEPNNRMQGKSLLFQITNLTSNNTLWRVINSQVDFRNVI